MATALVGDDGRQRPRHASASTSRRVDTPRRTRRCETAQIWPAAPAAPCSIANAASSCTYACATPHTPAFGTALSLRVRCHARGLSWQRSRGAIWARECRAGVWRVGRRAPCGRDRGRGVEETFSIFVGKGGSVVFVRPTRQMASSIRVPARRRRKQRGAATRAHTHLTASTHAECAARDSA